MKRIVIIGAVGGGATVAGQIRHYDSSAKITVFDRDSTMSYAACGTPYAIGDVIEDETSLIMADPKSFKDKRNIDVFMQHEVLEIQKEDKYVLVKDIASGKLIKEPYDFLILAPGGTAITPIIEGLETASAFSLRSYGDMQKIKAYIHAERPENCVISGAGFIGIEMAENLKNLGIDVHLVHKSPYVMSILDRDISEQIHTELALNDVKVYLDNEIVRINAKEIELADGSGLEADFIIMSIGLQPNIELATQAGLAIGKTGGILTNEFMQTSEPSIYALGDASENFDFITKDPKRVPLAWPAHRQAFIISRHLLGEPVAKKGLLGTSVVKVFNLTAAMTGLNERTIQEKGLRAETVVHRGNSNAGYYPDHSPITLKVHFDPDTRKILGAQCIGGKGVDKRIDVIVTAIYGGLTIEDLQELELCYAPPFSSPKDPVNMVGYRAVK
ncbi:MAG TPA: CoA-disulfide reductase [Planococcus sp. (in: firmicutes)]|nr:CoA-disulfide reductase [Planococcus sp. (in: firmicutes)]